MNNVETLCNVPLIMSNGAEWFAALGPGEERRAEAVLRQRPRASARVYEASMNVTLRELIYDRRRRHPRRPHAEGVIPGGSSVPILLPDQLDVPASFDGVAKAGSLLGSAGIIVMDDTTCMVWAAENLLHFYRTSRAASARRAAKAATGCTSILGKIERGEGQMRDLDLLLSVAQQHRGKTLCAFGDAAATPVLTTLKQFRAEYEAHIREGPLHRAGALAAARAPWWGRTDVMHAPLIAQLIVIGFVVLHAAEFGRRHRAHGAQGRGVRPAALRAHPGRTQGRLLQPLADIIKLMFKEELRPKAADKLLFALAPIISATAFAAFAVVPFGAATRRSSACSTSRSGCRSPTSTSASS